MKLWPVLTGIALSFTLIACKAPTPPKGVQPITNFDANRYLGKWYEIARLENRFERGLEQVSATYGKRNDGGIRVWICPYISRHLLSLNPLLACCRRYSRGER